MVCKRPFHDEDSYGFGCKYPRQHGHIDQQSPGVGGTHFNDGPQKHFSDEGENSARISQHEGEIAREAVTEDLNAAKNELELNASSSTTSYFWVNGNVIDELAESEPAVHLSFFPHYFELDHRVTGLVQPHDNYSVLLDRDLSIPVSVGPDHQADVPEWAPNSFSKSSVSSMVDDDDNNMAKLEGSCVIPMPDMESPAYNFCLDGETGNYCNCLDSGSVRCVKQHIMEAREKLRENVGQKVFEELGFCDMGEEVAKKWKEEEEETFHEVVLSNPASQGKNFWDHLSAVFPSRTKKDLVSYYFNVYMLRKRAEQNRFDPLNIDSDNDEWQISELGMTEEDDEDSVVESLEQDAHNQENHEGEFLGGIWDESREQDTCNQEYHEGEFQGGIWGENDTWKDDADSVNQNYVVGDEDEGVVDDVSTANGENFIGACGLDPVFPPSRKVSSNNGEDQDIQDDSCTSFEYQCDKVESCGPVDLMTDARESAEEQAKIQDP